jgi:UrcA family protein
METSMRAPHCFVALAALIVAGVTVGATISASELGAPPMSLTVQLGDLSTPDGVATLYARIRNAARTVCGYADNHFYQARAQWNGCVDRTIGHAIARVGNAKLTAYYRARSGRARSLPLAKIPSVADRLP